MTYGEAIRAILSPEYDAEVGLAGDLRMFIRIASQQAVVLELENLLDRASIQRRVFSDLIQMASVPPSDSYRNRFDNTLTTLLWLLNDRNALLGKQAALFVRNAPQCWWATPAARIVLATGLPDDARATRALFKENQLIAKESIETITQTGTHNEPYLSIPLDVLVAQQRQRIRANQ